jgi:hypothetical protein
LSFFVEARLAVGFGEVGDQVRGGGKQNPISGFDRFEAQSDGEVRLADAGRTEHQNVVAVLDEVAARECLHLLLVDRGLVRANRAKVDRSDSSPPCNSRYGPDTWVTVRTYPLR